MRCVTKVYSQTEIVETEVKGCFILFTHGGYLDARLKVEHELLCMG